LWERAPDEYDAIGRPGRRKTIRGCLSPTGRHMVDEFRRATPTTPTRGEEAPRRQLVGLADGLIARVRLRPTRLGRQMNALARRLEEELFPRARAEGLTQLRLSFETNGHDAPVTVIGKRSSQPLDSYEELAAFMAGVGVRSMVLDADLESNQVTDMLAAVWSVRALLAGREPGRIGRLLGRQRIRSALESDEGLHVACMDITLDAEAGRIEARNTYCQLTFSRAVTAYMRRVSRFHDHRALFVAAPRYALLAALLILVPGLAVAFLAPSSTTVAAITVGIAALAAVMTLIVLETIGAVEYDKEHQAKELAARHHALELAHNSIQMDFARARRIQRMLVRDARTSPLPERVATCSWFVPEMAVGGDYYDLKRAGEYGLAFILADVAGHGMSGAFVTGVIKTTFELGFDASGRPSEFVAKLNRVLDKMTPEDSFAAVIFGIYDTDRHVVTYTVAGHSPVPIIIRAAEGSLEKLDQGIGMIAGVSPDVQYEDHEARLEPGDKLVLCTDGITDAIDGEGDFFGTGRLEELLRQSAQIGAEGLCQRIADAVSRHAGQEPQWDDQTILILEILG